MYKPSRILNFGNNRSVSPVIGVIFMVAAVVIVAASIGVTVMNTADGVSDPTPQVKFDVEPAGVAVKITHTSGESFDGDQIRLAGAAAQEKIPEWSGETVSVGDTATVNTNKGDLKIVWESESGSDSTPLASSEVPDTVTTVEIEEINSRYTFHGAPEPWSFAKITMGEIKNTAEGDGEVYINNYYFGESTSSEDGQTISSGETKKFIAGHNDNLGNGDTVDLKIYESSDEEELIKTYTLEIVCWGYCGDSPYSQPTSDGIYDGDPDGEWDNGAGP